MVLRDVNKPIFRCPRQTPQQAGSAPHEAGIAAKRRRADVSATRIAGVLRQTSSLPHPKKPPWLGLASTCAKPRLVAQHMDCECGVRRPTPSLVELRLASWSPPSPPLPCTRVPNKIPGVDVRSRRCHHTPISLGPAHPPPGPHDLPQEKITDISSLPCVHIHRLLRLPFFIASAPHTVLRFGRTARPSTCFDFLD